MYRIALKYLLITLPVLLLFGCEPRKTSDGKAVAKVGSSELYMQDVASVIPNDIGQDDSIMMAEDYIKKWIKQELLLQKAEENLSDAEKDVSKQLEEYRKSLIL